MNKHLDPLFDLQRKERKGGLRNPEKNCLSIVNRKAVKWQFNSINSDLESTTSTVDIEEHFLILCWKIIVKLQSTVKRGRETKLRHKRKNDMNLWHFKGS